MAPTDNTSGQFHTLTVGPNGEPIDPSSIPAKERATTESVAKKITTLQVILAAGAALLVVGAATTGVFYTLATKAFVTDAMAKAPPSTPVSERFVIIEGAVSEHHKALEEIKNEMVAEKIHRGYQRQALNLLLKKSGSNFSIPEEAAADDKH